MRDLTYFSPDVTVFFVCVCVGGGFSAKLSKLKFGKMSIYSLKLTKLCMNKHFACIKALDIVLNPINVVCCGS